MSQPPILNVYKPNYEELESRLAYLEAELALVKANLQKEQLAHAQTKEQLYLAQQHFEGIFTNSPFPMVFFNADGSLIDINPYFEAEWGISKDNLPPNYNILTDPQLEAAGIMPIIRKAFEGESVSAPTILYDNTKLVLDNNQLKKKKRWLNSFFFPIKDQMGQLREIGLTHNELTAYKQSEELAYGQIETLIKSLKYLATQTDLVTFTNYVLKEITDQLGANNAGFFLVEEIEGGKLALVMKEFLKDGEFKDLANDPELTLFRQPWEIKALPNWENILDRQGKFHLVLPENASTFWPGTFDWHYKLGNKVILSYALTVGARPIGYLGLGYQSDYTPDEEKRELGQALVHQLTLAVQLRRLAQEAQQAAVVEERERSAQERVVQLMKANQLLGHNLATLGTQPKLDKFLKNVMCALNSQLEAAVTYLFLYEETNNTLNLSITVEQNQVVDWHSKSDIVEVFGNPFPENTSWVVENMIKERKPFIFNYLDDYQSGNTAIYWPGTLDWHLHRGHKWGVIVPLLLDQEFLGMLGIAFFRSLEITIEELELAQALANQLTLALQLTRLAEREQQEVTQTAILQERNRMAREIHDTLAQNLTGIVVQLQAADGKPNSDPTREGHFEAARQLAREALTEARHSVWALRPQALEGTDLPTAIAELIKKTAAVFRTTSPELVYQVEGTPYLLPSKLEEQILRVGQEALTNSLKYSGATKLEITLTFQVDGISLSIKDNGIGFELSQAEHKGFGLLGMRERATALKANLSFESQIGQGCLVFLFVPIKPN